jgi:aminoacrylate hydrolase
VLTLDAPSRVATLQLHGSWARTSGYALVSLSLLKRFLEVGGTDLYYEAAQLLQFPPAFFIDHYEEGAGMLRRLKAHPAPPMGLLGQLEANLQHDVAARLGEIKVPTLITVGEFDMCLPPHYSRELHRGIRGSELVIFPGGSHLVGMQEPDVFNRVTLDWLNRQVPAEA